MCVFILKIIVGDGEDGCKAATDPKQDEVNDDCCYNIHFPYLQPIYFRCGAANEEQGIKIKSGSSSLVSGFDSDAETNQADTKQSTEVKSIVGKKICFTGTLKVSENLVCVVLLCFCLFYSFCSLIICFGVDHGILFNTDKTC